MGSVPEMKIDWINSKAVRKPLVTIILNILTGMFTAERQNLALADNSKSANDNIMTSLHSVPKKEATKLLAITFSNLN